MHKEDIQVEQNKKLPNSARVLTELLQKHTEDEYILALRFMRSYAPSKSSWLPEEQYAIADLWSNGYPLEEIRKILRLDEFNSYKLYELVQPFTRADKMLDFLSSEESDLSIKDKAIAERLHYFPKILKYLDSEEIAHLTPLVPHYVEMLRFIGNGYSLYDYLAHGEDDPGFYDYLTRNFQQRIRSSNHILIELFARGNTDAGFGHRIALAKVCWKYELHGTDWYGEDPNNRILKIVQKIGKLTRKEFKSNEGTRYLRAIKDALNYLPVIEKDLTHNAYGHSNPYTVPWQHIIDLGIKHEGILPRVCIELIKVRARMTDFNHLTVRLSKLTRLEVHTVITMLDSIMHLLENRLTYRNIDDLAFLKTLLVNKQAICKEIAEYISGRIREERPEM